MRFDVRIFTKGHPIANEMDDLIQTIISKSELSKDKIKVSGANAPIGGFAMLDPETAAFIVQIMGTTAASVFVGGLVKIALEWVRVYNKPMIIKVGKSKVEISNSHSPKVAAQLTRTLMKGVSSAGSQKVRKKK